jgi:non-ribosomal peptide synthetase component F
MRITDWLAQLQVRQAEEQSHDRCLLRDIGRWSGAPSDEALFDSVVVFENYPAAEPDGDAAAMADDIRVTAFAGFEQGIDFPLCLTVAPGARLDFRLTFSPHRFDAAAINRLLDDIVRLLGTIAADPQQRLAALWPPPRGAGTGNGPWRDGSARQPMVGPQ